jgi:hypothetical protein
LDRRKFTPDVTGEQALQDPAKQRGKDHRQNDVEPDHDFGHQFELIAKALGSGGKDGGIDEKSMIESATPPMSQAIPSPTSAMNRSGEVSSVLI